MAPIIVFNKKLQILASFDINGNFKWIRKKVKGYNIDCENRSVLVVSPDSLVVLDIGSGRAVATIPVPKNKKKVVLKGVIFYNNPHLWILSYNTIVVTPNDLVEFYLSEFPENKPFSNWKSDTLPFNISGAYIYKDIVLLLTGTGGNGRFYYGMSDLTSLGMFLLSKLDGYILWHRTFRNIFGRLQIIKRLSRSRILITLDNGTITVDEYPSQKGFLIVDLKHPESPITKSLIFNSIDIKIPASDNIVVSYEDSRVNMVVNKSNKMLYLYDDNLNVIDSLFYGNISPEWIFSGYTYAFKLKKKVIGIVSYKKTNLLPYIEPRDRYSLDNNVAFLVIDFVNKRVSVEHLFYAPYISTRVEWNGVIKRLMVTGPSEINIYKLK